MPSINELLPFAIRILFAGEGVINNLLLEMGLLDAVALLLDVVLYWTYICLYPLMIFPLYNVGFGYKSARGG